MRLKLIMFIKRKILNFFLNFIIIIFSIFLTFGIIEIILRITLNPLSSSFNSGILNKKFSDLNYILDKKKFRNKDVVNEADFVFLGDSFTFGWGLPVHETFPEIFRNKYYNKTIYNLGIPGTNTIDQYQILKNYPLKDNSTVIYQYFYNDIDYISKKIISKDSFSQNYFLLHVKKITLFLIDRSYLADLILNPFLKFFLISFNEFSFDKHNYEKHLGDVKLIFDFLKKKKIKVVFVLIPILSSDKQIKFSSDNYINFFKKNFYKICNRNDILIDISTSLGKDNSKKFIISNRDLHASYFVNKIIADQIYNATNNKENMNNFNYCR